MVLVAAALVAMLALPVRTWFLQQARIAEAEAELSSAQDRVAQLQQQQTMWQDPLYVEQQARLRLNYVKPGEAGVVVIKPNAGLSASGSQPRTWYDSLWQTVESASGRGETALGDPVQVRPSAPR